MRFQTFKNQQRNENDAKFILLAKSDVSSVLNYSEIKKSRNDSEQGG